MIELPATVSSRVVQQCLHDLQRREHGEASTTQQIFVQAACLVDTFSVPQLREFAGLPRDADWVQLSIDAELVAAAQNAKAGTVAIPARWRLRPAARRRALQQLRSEGRLAQALAALPAAVSERDTLLRQLLGAGIDLQQLDFRQTALLREVLHWLEGSEFAAPALIQAAARRLDRLQLFKPFQRLLADGFQGRQKELKTLRDYVGVAEPGSELGRVVRRFALRSAPGASPLVLYGPGGIGKSTVLAQFLMEHCGPDVAQPLPFVYIDIDRLGFRTADFGHFTVEAVRQLARQASESTAMLESELTLLQAAASESSSSDAGARNVNADEWLNRFAAIIERLAEFRGLPLILVIDTFEEIQRRGNVEEDFVWDVLVRLQREIPDLRTVVSGRAPPRQSAPPGLRLQGLERPASEALVDTYLAQHELGRLDAVTRKRVLDIARDNPLTLRLALRLLRQHGAAALADIATTRWLVFRLAEEKVQALLHTRVLSHIDDEEVRRLAHPGLAVRRITPEVISEVLASPCRIAVRDAAHAQSLFERLQREVGLVEIDADGSLLHRSDVRSVMLESLLAEAGSDTIRKIDNAAIAYYQDIDTATARAEEIYHRLRQAQPAAQIDARWRDDVAVLLGNAIDELPAASRLYLASRLGLSVDEDLRRTADQGSWERLAARRARAALNRGALDTARAVLVERTERLDGSPLWEIQAELQRSTGQFEAAIDHVDRAVAAGGFAACETVTLQFVAVLAAEALGDYTQARQRLTMLQAMNAFHTDEMLKLRLDVCAQRLARLAPAVPNSAAKVAGTAKPPLPPALRRRDGQINLNGLRQLKLRPLLLRETVAEYGLAYPEILYYALEQLGLPGRGTQDWATRIARGLDDANAWGSEQELRRDLAAKLHAVAETDASGKRRDSSRQSAELLQSLANWMRHDADAAGLRELIVQGFRGDIAANLQNQSTAATADPPFR